MKKNTSISLCLSLSLSREIVLPLNMHVFCVYLIVVGQ